MIIIHTKIIVKKPPPVIVKPKVLPLESEGGKPHPSNLSGMVICLQNCNSTSKNIKDIIRCSICMSLFHKSCLGEEAKYPGGWNCKDCRLILHNLVTLLKHSQEMKVSIDEINGKLMSVIDKLDQTNDELLTQRQINSDLLKEVDSQSTIIQTLRDDNFKLQKEIGALSLTIPPRAEKPELLIGTSMIRNIKAKDENKLDIRRMSGAKLADIRDTLSSLQQEEKSYKTVVIVAGSIDCENSSAECTSIMSEMETCIKEALNISQRVTISSILPRTDKGPPNLKGENLNLLLKHYADQNMNIKNKNKNKNVLFQTQIRPITNCIGVYMCNIILIIKFLIIIIIIIKIVQKIRIYAKYAVHIPFV